MRWLPLVALCLGACDPEASGYDDDILTINEEESVDDVQIVENDAGAGGGALLEDEEDEDVDDADNDGIPDAEEDADDDNDGILDEDDPDFGLFEP